MSISFKEDNDSGYKSRTVKNASSDVTMAFACDFTSAGERLTKKSVLEQGKKYIPIDLNNLEITDERIDKIISSINSISDITLTGSEKELPHNGKHGVASKWQKKSGKFRQELLDNGIISTYDAVLNGHRTQTSRQLKDLPKKNDIVLVTSFERQSIPVLITNVAVRSVKEQIFNGKKDVWKGEIITSKEDLKHFNRPIFCFGSNTEGRHSKGSALTAKEKFGAIYGRPDGLQGDSYAIITKDLTLPKEQRAKSRTPVQIKEQINKLYLLAESCKDRDFIVVYTKDPNLNGYSSHEMAKMFAEHNFIPENIIFNEEFNKMVYQYYWSYKQGWDVSYLKDNPDVLDKFDVDFKIYKKEISLNIAGNGLYTLKNKYTQQQVDDFVFKFLKKIIEHKSLKVIIKSICTGGQSGLDESGAKAGLKLNIPTFVLCPKGWKFRDFKGVDVYDENLFKKRFSIL